MVTTPADAEERESNQYIRERECRIFPSKEVKDKKKQEKKEK